MNVPLYACSYVLCMYVPMHLCMNVPLSMYVIPMYLTLQVDVREQAVQSVGGVVASREAVPVHDVKHGGENAAEDHRLPWVALPTAFVAVM